MPKTIISCALTGGAPRGKNPNIPITPSQIAAAGVEAASAGASVLHIHVRDPQTGAPSMELDLYRETVERIRESGTDVLINLTTGPGAAFHPGEADPSVAGPGTNFVGPVERTRHVAALRPDICSLDLGTLWLRNRAWINPPAHLAEMASIAYDAGALPEIEIFDTGDLLLAVKRRSKGTPDRRRRGTPFSDNMMLVC